EMVAVTGSPAAEPTLAAAVGPLAPPLPPPAIEAPTLLVAGPEEPEATCTAELAPVFPQLSATPLAVPEPDRPVPAGAPVRAGDDVTWRPGLCGAGATGVVASSAAAGAGAAVTTSAPAHTHAAAPRARALALTVLPPPASRGNVGQVLAGWHLRQPAPGAQAGRSRRRRRRRRTATATPT